MNLLVSDIDGTLANDNKPVLPMCQLLQSLAHNGDWQLAFVTSRQAKLRQPTMAWLMQHCPVGDQILMRPDDDWDPAPLLKQRLVLTLLKDYTNVIAIDSRDDICLVYKQIGLQVLQCL
jgi:hypothetical protein